MSEFAISYAAGLLPFLGPLGVGPRHARVVIDEQTLTVRMGWAFRTRVPLSVIASADRDDASVSGWGAHVWRGVALVNGSSRGMVRVEVEPPGSARLTGIPMKLRALRLSLEQPEAFLQALRAARGAA